MPKRSRICGEHLGLFDGVDAEVGFEVEVEVEQVGGVAGLVGHHRDHLGLHVGRPRCRGPSRRGLPAPAPAPPAEVVDAGAGSAVADEGDDVGEGGVVAQLELVVAFDVEAFADLGEDLGLFDGVDAEVGFEVEVEVEQVGGVAGLVGHHRDHLGLHVGGLDVGCLDVGCLDVGGLARRGPPRRARSPPVSPPAPAPAPTPTRARPPRRPPPARAAGWPAPRRPPVAAGGRPRGGRRPCR